MVKNILPLTETVYYILMAFQKPTYGYLAIKDIEEMSLGEVRIAAGTMYGAIDTLLKNKMISGNSVELFCTISNIVWSISFINRTSISFSTKQDLLVFNKTSFGVKSVIRLQLSVQ